MTDRSARSPLVDVGRWLALVALVFAVVAGAMTLLGRSLPTSSPAAEAAAGALDLPAPDFRLMSLDGGVLGPPDFLGKTVVIDFWATWCGPCRLQAAYMEELHDELSSGAVQLLAVNLGEDEETVREFAAKTPFSYPVLLDPDDELTQRYNIFGLPTVMVIGPAGDIRFMESRVVDAETLRQEIAKAGA